MLSVVRPPLPRNNVGYQIADCGQVRREFAARNISETVSDD